MLPLQLCTFVRLPFKRLASRTVPLLSLLSMCYRRRGRGETNPKIPSNPRTENVNLYLADAQKAEKRKQILGGVNKRNNTEEPSSYLFRLLSRGVRSPKLPKQDDLIEVAKRVFPAHMDLPVYVCGYLDNHSMQFATTSAQIESCKPGNAFAMTSATV